MTTPSEGGFALIAALWIVAVVSAVSVAIAAESRLRTATVATELAKAQADRSADAGLAHAGLTLAQRLASVSGPTLDADPWGSLVGRTLTESLEGGASYRIVFSDPEAALNVNQASEEQLELLLRALGESDVNSASIAAAILDWRDEDDVARPHGAEREQYVAVGSWARPRNGHVRSIGELRQVHGIDDVYPRLAPYLTRGGRGRININRAEGPVLLTLPGFDQEAVRAVSYRRSLDRPFVSIYELALSLSPESRRRMEAVLPELTTRAVVQTSAMEARILGYDVTQTSTSVIDAEFVRMGSAVHLASRRSQ